LSKINLDFPNKIDQQAFVAIQNGLFHKVKLISFMQLLGALSLPLYFFKMGSGGERLLILFQMPARFGFSVLIGLWVREVKCSCFIGNTPTTPFLLEVLAGAKSEEVRGESLQPLKEQNGNNLKFRFRGRSNSKVRPVPVEF
jgi:hypothetical protein